MLSAVSHELIYLQNHLWCESLGCILEMTKLKFGERKTFPKGHPERGFELNCSTPESILLIWILKLKSLSHWTNGLQILFPKDEGDKNSRILPQLFFCCFITTVQCIARWNKKPQPCFKNSLKFLHLLCSLSKPALYRTWNPTACFVGCSDWLKEKPDWPQV